jgi:predicted nucleotidyltransferase
MSLAGFDHVFADAVEMELSIGTRIRVAPPIVTTLLKIIAYVEDPYRRAKDLQDIRLVLGRYEAESDRLFSDEVFDAALPDFEMANAFLLGRDLRALATPEDASYVEKFLDRFLPDEQGGDEGDAEFAARVFRCQIHGLHKGFSGQ